jgi:hypothetical protein
VLDLAGKASPEGKDNAIETLSSTTITNTIIPHTLEIDTDTHLASEIDTHPNDGTITRVLHIDKPWLPAPLDRALVTQLRARQLSHLERRLELEIFTHLLHESDIATVNSLLEWEPGLIPTMKFAIEIHSH